jgi:4-carboxymuconolactone decarboxylase
MAAKAGVTSETIDDLRAGRRPASAKDDELAIYDFVQELYRERRVSDGTYARLHAFLGNAAMVECVGILGYYVLISMTLNVFQMLPPETAELAFAESEVGNART